MRTEDVLRVGGYDPTLRDRAAQGCEDWYLYFKLAQIGEFAVVKAPLTGYRQTKQSMSTDVAQMLRSHALVMSDIKRTLPNHEKALRRGRQEVARYYLRRAIRAARYRAASQTLWQIVRTDLTLGLHLVTYFPRTLKPTKLLRRFGAARRSASGLSRPLFLDTEPQSDDHAAPVSQSADADVARTLAALLPSSR